MKKLKYITMVGFLTSFTAALANTSSSAPEATVFFNTPEIANQYCPVISDFLYKSQSDNRGIVRGKNSEGDQFQSIDSITRPAYIPKNTDAILRNVEYLYKTNIENWGLGGYGYATRTTATPLKIVCFYTYLTGGFIENPIPFTMEQVSS